MDEIFVSTDVETDGLCPGLSSMLSLGSAAYRADKTLVSTFTVNLELLPGASPSPQTTAWWNRHPDAWAACRENPEPPQQAMARYVEWVKALPGTPVFVAYPVGVDFTFVYWYLMTFAGECPFGQSALDIKTFAMAVLKTTFHHGGTKQWPDYWREGLPHTHVALADAIEQGIHFCNMLHDNRFGPPGAPLMPGRR